MTRVDNEGATRGSLRSAAMPAPGRMGGSLNSPLTTSRRHGWPWAGRQRADRDRGGFAERSPRDRCSWRPMTESVEKTPLAIVTTPSKRDLSQGDRATVSTAALAAACKISRDDEGRASRRARHGRRRRFRRSCAATCNRAQQHILWRVRRDELTPPPVGRSI